MWHRKLINKFLLDQKAGEITVASIQERISKVAADDGSFSGGKLVYVLGDAELAKRFEQAWETDPALHKIAAELFAKSES